MFLTANVPALFKKGVLKLIQTDDGTRRAAEATLVIEPFPVELARELGEEIAGYLFDGDGKIREELEAVDLRVRAGLQSIVVRHHEDLEAIAILSPVSIKDISAKRIEDDKMGRVWLSFSFVLVFSLDAKETRNFVLDEFGKALLWSFTAMQRELLDKASLHDAIARMVPEGTSVSAVFSGGEMHEIDPKAHRTEAKRLRDQAKAH